MGPVSILRDQLIRSRPTRPTMSRMGRRNMKTSRAFASTRIRCSSLSAFAADYPAPKQGDWVARDFKFHTGEVMPELRCTTPPSASRPASRCWCCTARPARPPACSRPPSPASCSAPASRSTRRNTTSSFPTRSAHGKSTKPSDGLQANFPHYNYDDMVDGAVPAASPKASASSTCASSSATRWAACRPGSGARNIPASWTRWCRWRRSRPRWRAATG